MSKMFRSYKLHERRPDSEIRQKDNLRNYQRSMRLISTMQRSIMKIVASNSYPSENTVGSDLPEGSSLYGANYKRNGDETASAVTPKSVVLNIEGKEGLLPTPAENVIGESPMMNDILSKPTIRNLLCELRNTSILMSNSKEFEKFAKNFKNHPHYSELPFKDSARDYIQAYRIMLIKHFLIALKSEVDDVLKEDSKSIAVLKEETKALVLQKKMTIGEWNETQMQTRAINKQKEEERAKFAAQKEARERAEALAKELEIEAASKLVLSEDELLHRQLKAYSVIPTLYTNRNIGFETYRHPPNNEIPQIPVVPTNIKEEEEKCKLLDKGSSKGTNISIKQKRKDDFIEYVHGLIADVRRVSEMRKNVKGLQKKKPKTNERIADSLIRLLGKESLFKSLNADDFIFLDYEGGKKKLEKRMAKKLNLSNQLKPGGFTFIVPSRSELQDATDVELDKQMSETWDKVIGSTNSNSSRPDSGDSLNSKSTLQKESRIANYKKSIGRVCCPACKTKVKQLCEGIQSRNLKSLREMSTWQSSTKQIVHLDNKSMPIDKHQTHHFLKFVPDVTHKNYSHKFTRFENLPKKTLAEIQSKASGGKKEVKSILAKKGVVKVASKRVDFSSTWSASEASQKLTEQENPSKSKSKVMFSSKPHQSIQIPSLIKYSDIESSSSYKSWSLLISKMDILKLMHELETHGVSEKKNLFESQFFQFK